MQTLIHIKASIPRGDPEGMPRSFNIAVIEDEMEREELFHATFLALQQRLESGESIDIVEPYTRSGYSTGKWDLFSSEVFTKYLLDEIDNTDFAAWRAEFGASLCLHHPDPTVPRPSCMCVRG
jgi:hypothetical protein